MSEHLNKITEIVKKIEEKDFTIYFFAVDSNGVPNAGVSQIYKTAKHLIDLGYKAAIMKEKDKQEDAGTWIGIDYLGLPHVKAEGTKITGEDVIVIPELFSSVMDSVKDFPCRKIVYLQNYTFALQVLEMGVSWLRDYKFTDAIVTNDNMKTFVEDHFHGMKVHTIPVSIDPIYKSTDKLRKPTILIASRNSESAMSVIKSFYLKNPIYSWVTFKQVHNFLPHELVEEMNTAAALVWIDPKASFGTLPLEAMACGLPLIGLVPDVKPEWLNVEDGIWVGSEYDLSNAIEMFLSAWVENDKRIDLLSTLSFIPNSTYTVEKQKDKTKEVFENISTIRLDELKKYLVEKDEK